MQKCFCIIAKIFKRSVKIRRCHNRGGCRNAGNCIIPVLENHPGDSDKALDDKIRHKFIVIYCSWTDSIAQPSNNGGWPTLHRAGRNGENPQLPRVIVRKEIAITKILHAKMKPITACCFHQTDESPKRLNVAQLDINPKNEISIALSNFV